MTSATGVRGLAGADLAELRALRTAWGHHDWGLGGSVDELAAALHRVTSGSTAYVPHLAPHAVRGARLVARLGELALRADRAGAALAAADRWVGWRVGEAAVDTVRITSGAVDGWHAGVWNWHSLRCAVLGEAGVGARLQALGAVADDHAAAGTLRAILREIGADTAHAFGRTSATVGEAVGDAADVGGVHDPGRAASGRAGWLRGVVANSRVGAVARLGGRGLAGVGVAISVRDLWVGVRERDVEQGVKGGLATAASIAAVIPVPPVQVAAAAITVGLLVHEHRGELAGAGRAAAEGARDLVDAARDAMEGLF